MNFGLGPHLTILKGVTISGNWIRERILGDDGSGAFAETYYAALEVVPPRLPVSIHVAGWTTDESFDGVRGTPFRVSEFESELTWQLMKTVALSTGLRLDRTVDTGSLTSNSYALYCAELSTRATRSVTFSLQAAHAKGTASGSAATPFQTGYSETSVRLGMKVQSGENFFTELGVLLRNNNQAQLLSFSGRLAF